jgi:hypothetical protein
MCGLCVVRARVYTRVGLLYPDADHITVVGFSCSLLLLCTSPISGKVLLLICKKQTLLIFELAKHRRSADLHHQQCVCGVSERRNRGTIRATPTPAIEPMFLLTRCKVRCRHPNPYPQIELIPIHTTIAHLVSLCLFQIFVYY